MIKISALVLSIILLPGLSLAQLDGIPGAPLNPGSGVGGEFDSEYESMMEGELDDNPSDPSAEFFGYTHTDNLSSSTATIHLNPKNACGGGTCSILEGGFASGAKTVPLAALLPGVMKGHSSYLWNNSLASMSQANLNSANVVWNVSMFLAEPAVAQGQHNAAMLAAAMNQTGYLEQINFNAQAQNIQGAKPALEAYQWCIHKALKDGKGLAKARIICARDDGNTAPQASTPLDGTDTALGVPRGFQFLDLPSRTIETGGMGLPLTNVDPRLVLLSDIIFNEEAMGAGVLGGPELIKFKNSFKELYGDIKFTNELPTNGGLVMEQKFETIGPTIHSDLAYQGMVIYKFNALRQVVFKHCDEMASPDLSHSHDLQSYKLTSLIPTGPSAIGSKITMEDIKALSIPGFTMNGAAIVGLRNWYRDAFYEPNANLGGVGLPGGKVNCDPLENSGDYAVIALPPFQGAPVNLNYNPFESFNEKLSAMSGREFFVMLYNSAKLLALGEWLAKAALAEQLLSNMTGGIEQSPVFGNMAKELVYKAAGTKEIRASLDATAEKLREHFLSVYERQDSSGQSAAQRGSNLAR